MAIKDVRVDTAFDLQAPEQRNKNMYYVVALKPCGCTGPLMGRIERVRVTDWPAVSTLPERPESAPDEGLWAARPIVSRHGSPHRRITYAWSPEGAALELRKWWGMRNVRSVLHRSERKREAI